MSPFDPALTVPPREAPSYVLWEITRACNLRCAHCAAGAGRRREGELSTAEALALCDELADLGVPAVCLMGGEPLVRRDWPELARRLRQRGVAVGVVTNGWLLDGRAAGVMEDLGVCQVGTSLDAADPGLHDRMRGRPGAHRRALQAIDRIRGMSLDYRTVITSVSRTNLAELPALADLLARRAPGFTWMVNVTSGHDPDRMDPGLLLGPEGFLALARFIADQRTALRGRLEVTGTHDLGYFSRDFQDLHDFRWHGCVAGLETLGIRSDGDVAGCLVMDDDFVEGNVRRRRLRELWEDPSAFAYNRRFTPDLLEGACSGCVHGRECRGGCRDHAASFTGRRFDYPFCLHRIERDREEAARG